MQPNREQYAPLPGRARPYSARVQVAGLAAFLVASFLVAALGGLSTVDNVDGWYATADKAPWSPPNGLFGPVWTVLYAAMALAAWLVWRSRTEQTRTALTFYAIQLGLNLAGQRGCSCCRTWRGWCSRPH